MKPRFSLIKLSCGNIVLAGLFACLFSWVIEAAIHSYVLREGSLDSHFFSMTSHHVSIWFINSIFFVGFGVYAQSKFDKSIRKQNELKSSCDELGGRLNAQSQILAAETQCRRKAESALRQEEVKFRDLFDNINDGILIADSATKKFIEVNRTMCNMLGYTRQEVLSLDIEDIHPQQDLPAVFAAFERYVRSNEKVAEDLPVMRKDGTVFYADIGHTTVSLNGSPCAVGVFRDITGRKRQEEELETRRRQLGLIIDSSPIIIFYKDRDSKFVRVNSAFAGALERRKEDFVGKTVFDFFSSRIARDMTSDDRQVLQSGRPKLNIIEQYESAQGMRWVQTDKIPIYDEKGTPSGLIGFAQDITERKRAEEKVRQFSAEQKIILDNIASGVFYVKNRTVQWANKNAEKLFGYSLDEINGKDTAPFYPDRGSFEQFGREAYPLLSQGKTYSAERQMKMKGGGLIWCRITGRAVNGVSPEEGAIWLVDDITERKETEKSLHNYRQQLEAMVEDRTMDLEKNIGKLRTEVHERKRAEDTLRRNSALLRGVFEGIQDGIAVIDMDRNIIMVNRAVERFFRSEGAIGFKTKKCFQVFRRATERCNNCASVRAIEEKTTQVEIIPYKTAGDGAGWLERFTFPLYDEHGVVRGVILYLRDITEKTVLEERARRNHHLAALGQISARIAHEINNPNHIIMSGAELLHDVWHDADSVLSEYYALHDDFLLGGVPFSEMQEKVPQIINRILNGSRRINDIVIGMKRYTSSARVAKTEKVNINDVARTCIEMLNDQIRKSTDNFQSILDDEVLRISGSRQALEEVIVNLVSNALEALTNRTKMVSVATRHDRNVNSVILEVRDEGMGMTSEVLRQATNPFFTTKQDSGGMGLGLSISLAIVKNHDGSLDFESKPGQGTVATVRLPVSYD